MDLFMGQILQFFNKKRTACYSRPLVVWGSMQWVPAYKDVPAPLPRARSRHIQIS
jgi:hypothetical protein